MKTFSVRSSCASRRFPLPSHAPPSSASSGGASSPTPHFRRRFRAHHKIPPLLGFFWLDFDRRMVHRLVYVFTPTLGTPDRIPPARFSVPAPPCPGKSFCFLGCRHGLALALLLGEGPSQAVVWDPVTNSRCCIDFPPDFKTNSSNAIRMYHGAVLRDCGYDAFKLVMMFYDTLGDTRGACIYDSELGKWGDMIIISTVAISISSRPSVLVGSKLYWLLGCRMPCFLQIDVDRQSSAVIQMSEDIPVTGISHVQALRAEDGGLGFAVVSQERIQLWGRTSISGHVVRGVLQRTVELDQLLSLPLSTKMSIVGYDEDSNVIFIGTTIGIFMIQLESMKFTKVSDSNHVSFPFGSFYTAVGGGAEMIELMLNNT